MPTRLTQTGAEVQDDLYKIEDIDLATEEKAGLMSPEDKAKLDNIDSEIPTKLSELEQDSAHRTVTDTEKQTWNNKSDFDGRYDSLIGRPYIPQRTSDLRNDSGFITNVVNNLVNYYLKSEVYTKDQVDQIVSTVGGFTVRVVDTLPTASEETMRALYLVPSADPEAGNVKDEWITIENTGTYSWERIGSTEINLDGYVTDDDLTAALQGYVTSAAFATALAGKQDVIQDLESIRAGATAGATAYQKPQSGIPASDMTEAVRASLGKADTALQSFTETDPTVPAWAKANNPPTEIFWATYGTTTISEIDIAVSSGKSVMCNHNSVTYLLTQHISTSAYYYFESFINDSAPYLLVKVSDSSWLSGSLGLQRTDRRVDDITGNESATNKYPSTKAVADYVASKTEVYGCTYGTTTYSAVVDAITAGKIPVVKYNSQLYIYTETEASQIIFISVSSFYINRVMVKTDDTWYTNSYICEVQSNRRSSFQSTPDDTHYPTEKLVKDSLDAKADIDALGKWGVVSQTQTWTNDYGSYTLSNIVRGIIPQHFIDQWNIYTKYFGEFNIESGYFELNGLTDISYYEAIDIVKHYVNGSSPSNSEGWRPNSNPQANFFTARTNIPFLANQNTSIYLTWNQYIEVSQFRYTPQSNSSNWQDRLTTYGNYRLKRMLDIYNITSSLTLSFCYALEECYFLLKNNASFSAPESKYLSLASVVYMVDNAENTSAITITLHATAYARCQADTTEYTYNGQTYTGILAYASARNITIASA